MTSGILVDSGASRTCFDSLDSFPVYQNIKSLFYETYDGFRALPPKEDVYISMMQEVAEKGPLPEEETTRPDPNWYYGFVANAVQTLANDKIFNPAYKKTWPGQAGLRCS